MQIGKIQLGSHLYHGIVLLVLGVLFLLGTLGLISFSFLVYWPLFLILLGVKYLVFPKSGN